ncbi:Serine/threonine-protein phosphatase 7 long form-like [Vitis vinifera]|uniref:Serine/threonine-protein phosphatase 7 long form-like n=1 Tax=Vitis vinifera TaxID=29760 RepID=A0A438JNU1_VITVI|nr:Serine/threonine-protein phosphatase 7 long form-like [Vitis vinifera]
MDPRLRPYIIRSGFYGVYCIGHITLDWGLITSLVERWRPETHIFHLPIGEMTITLQDIAVILGLRIHGLPITGTCDIDWSLLYYELLGVIPPTSKIKGSMISTRCLCHQFSHPPVDSDDTTLERWDSAVLAHLYRELCRASLDGATDIIRCVTLLQLWSWKRLHLGRPYFGQPPVPPTTQHLEHDAVDDLPVEHLDQRLHDEALLDEGLLADPLEYRWRVPLSWDQNPSHVLWEPNYMGDLVVHLPAISLADQEIWQTSSPLICFDIVKWHRLERGRHKYDWGAFYAHYITLWASRVERIATAPPMVGAMQFHDPYMEWYRCITRCLITPPLHID